MGESGWDEVDLADGEDSIPSRCGSKDKFDFDSGESDESDDDVDALRCFESRPLVIGDESGGDSNGGGEYV